MSFKQRLYRTGKPPLILIFQIGSIAPSIYPDKQLVLSMSVYEWRNIKLVGIPRALSVANQLAVHPDMVSAVDSVEAHPQVGVQLPRGRDMELLHVGAGRVLRRHMRRAYRDGKLDVGVVRYAMTLKLPMSWNLNGRPGRRWSREDGGV
jgi:hypothetical protein